MGFPALQVQMLGRFALKAGNSELNDSDNRSKKIWLLLAYMIYCRNRVVSQEELVDLLWSGEKGSINPANALKTMFHRARSMLNKLDESAGHTLILYQDGKYVWNREVPLTLDVEEFEARAKAAAAEQDPSARLDMQLEVLALYQGDFLPKLSAEAWTVPISAYFHNLYLQTVLDVLPALQSRSRMEELISLCHKVIELDPYD